MVTALKNSKDICKLKDVQSLSRNNFISNLMKSEINGVNLDDKLLEDLLITDSNNDRKYLIHACINSIAYAKESRFKDAINEFKNIFYFKKDKIAGRKKALKCISILLEKFDDYKNSPLIDFSNIVKEYIDDQMTKVTGGKVKPFYKNHTFNQLFLCVSIPEDLSLHKTIHKAKGDEFENVLLVLKKESDIDFLLKPDLENNEEHRIYYVAMSRARNHLFISVPSLDINKYKLLDKHFKMEIV
jgi:DNA helicase-2/ATP-dependent DNA helicase PcrA